MGDRAGFPSTNVGSVGHVYVSIKLKLNGASAPTILSGAAFLDPTKPPTHSGGTNVVQLFARNPWLEVVAHAVDVRDDTPNGAYATIGSIANEGKQGLTGASGTPGQNLSFKVATWTAGGAAANDSSLIIAIMLEINNSSATYGNS